MPEAEKIVINATPLIALVAALSDLSILQSLWEGYSISIALAIERMRNRGIRLSETLMALALEEAGEA